jgi:hypothetical protein
MQATFRIMMKVGGTLARHFKKTKQIVEIVMVEALEESHLVLLTLSAAAAVEHLIV